MALIPATFHDILTAPATATLTTNGPDGYPQSTALWYLFDPVEGVIRIVMQASTQKARNLRRDGHCTFLLIDPANSGRAIEIRADAELAIEQGEFVWAERIVNHYGTSMATMSNLDAPRAIATLRPVRVNTHG